MRIAFSTLAFPGRSLTEALDLGAGWGYEGVELRLVDGELVEPGMGVAQRDRVAEVLGRAGLPVAALDSSVQMTAPGAAAAVVEMLEIAAQWGAPLVRVFGGSLPEDPAARREALLLAGGALREAASAAKEMGIAIGLETHDSFSSSSVVAELLATVPENEVGAVWDSYHPHRMGDRPAMVLADIGSRTLLAQVKDARRVAGGWELVLLGEGEVPVREILRLLKGSGYDRWVSVEWEKAWHPEIAEPEVALPQHLALLGSWLAEDAGA